jgi:hypothetical protein
MAADPKTLTNPRQLRVLADNARRLGRDDIVVECNIRIGELAGQVYDDVLDREFWMAVSCAEEFRSQETGRTSRFSRTRQKYGRVGAKRCLEDWALDNKVTDGFLILLRHGRPDMTGEAIVIRHAAKFSPAAVTSARRKLEAHGAVL